MNNHSTTDNNRVAVREEGSAPPPFNQGKPNAYYLQNSQYLKKEERDPDLVKSPSRGGYLIPFKRHDLLGRYQERYGVESVFDPIIDKPKEVQRLESIKSWKHTQQREKFQEINKRCQSLGITINKYQTQKDPQLHLLKRDYEGIKEEIKQIDKDVKHHEKGHTERWEDPVPLPDNLPPVQPLDPEMIPEALRGWIMDIAERMQIPPDFSAASSVVVLGALIGRKIGIYPKQRDDWLVIPNLWGAIVGRPSLLKSPAIAEVMKPLDRLVVDAMEKHKEDMLVHERETMLLEAQKGAFKDRLKQEAKKASKKGDDFGLQSLYEDQDNFEPPEKPVLKRYKTEDGTVEKIGEILQGNPQGILIHRDELSGWLKSMDKYGREGDRAFYLEAWNGSGSFTVDRIGRGTLHIPALCISLLGGIQPGPLSAYVNQATSGGLGDDGLLQRFQVLVWPDAPKKWKNVDRFPNSEARDRAYEVFRKLDAIELEVSEEKGKGIPALRFSDEAQVLFDEWRKNLEKRLRGGDLSSSQESHLAKFRSLLPSLALIFQMVESVDEEEELKCVGVSAVRKAEYWCEYLEIHACRLYASAGTPEVESAKALLKKIKSRDIVDGFSLRDVYYGKHWAKLANRKEVEGAVNVLQDMGWLRLAMAKTNGRPIAKVVLHPDVFTFL